MPAPIPSSIPLGEWSGSDATNALHQTIKEFVVQSDKQATTMIRLTRRIEILTVVMLMAVGVQIYEAWPADWRGHLERLIEP